MRFDIETFLDQLEAKMKTSLAAKIDEINAEKGDSILDKIPDAAWIFGSLDDKAKNFRDFLFYYIDDIETKIAGPKQAQEFTIELDLFIFDRQDMKTQRRSLRYHRALMDAVAETWGTVGRGYGSADMFSLIPIEVKLNNSSFFHKILGVSLKFTIQG